MYCNLSEAGGDTKGTKGVAKGTREEVCLVEQRRAMKSFLLGRTRVCVVQGYRGNRVLMKRIEKLEKGVETVSSVCVGLLAGVLYLVGKTNTLEMKKQNIR